MGKWGCRGIPLGRRTFHHPLHTTADLEAKHAPACRRLRVKRGVKSADCDTLSTGVSVFL